MSGVLILSLLRQRVGVRVRVLSGPQLMYHLGSNHRAAIATFPSPKHNRNVFVQIEPSRTVAELSQLLLQRK